MGNIDHAVVKDFGHEWGEYSQDGLSDAELERSFNQYFHIFPFDKLDQNAQGFDMGCGSGRWAKLVAPRVGTLNCIDPSDQALNVAKDNLTGQNNVNFFVASVDEDILEEKSQDFGYCLGVLHHIPDTLAGLHKCSALLKSGAPFLVYLYYRFDHKPWWFKMIWRASDIIRRFTCKLPFPLKKFVALLIAIFVYMPLARFALLMEKIGRDVENIPLTDYRNKSFYFIRTDALDRFGTRLEHRYTRDEIVQMLESSGFENITFSDQMPYWTALAWKK